MRQKSDIVCQQSDDYNAQQKGKKTLLLDLDETLVHASFEYIPNPDYTLVVVVEGFPYRFHIKVRPYVDEFLEQMSNFYEIMIFTASLKEYADEVLKLFFNQDKISYRLYRQHCKFNGKNYVKDISRVPRNLKDLIIVDNQLNCFAMHPQNGFLIKNFYDDQEDRELIKLIPFLKFLSDVNDIRDIRQWHFQFRQQGSISYISMNNKEQIWNPPVKTQKNIELSGNVTSDEESEQDQNNILKQKEMEENTPFNKLNIEEKDEKVEQNFNLLEQNVVKPSSFNTNEDFINTNMEIQPTTQQNNSPSVERSNIIINSKEDLDQSLDSDLEEEIQNTGINQNKSQIRQIHKKNTNGQFTAIQEVTEYEDQEPRSRGNTGQQTQFCGKSPRNDFSQENLQFDQKTNKEQYPNQIQDEELKKQKEQEQENNYNQYDQLNQKIQDKLNSPKFINSEMIQIQINEHKNLNQNENQNKNKNKSISLSINNNQSSKINNQSSKNNFLKKNTHSLRKSNIEGIYNMEYQNSHLQELMTMKTETVLNEDEIPNHQENQDQFKITNSKNISKQLTSNNNNDNLKNKSSSIKRMNFSKTQSFNTIYLDNKSHFSNSNIQAQHPSNIVQEQTKNIIFMQNQELIRQSTSYNQEMFSINNASMKSSNINQNNQNNLNSIIQSKNIQQSQFNKEDAMRQFKDGVKFAKTQDITGYNSNNNKSEMLNNNNKKGDKQVFKSLQAQQLKTFQKLKTLGQNQQIQDKVNEFFEKSKCVNQLEPDKDWRHILQINSPENDSEDAELEQNFENFEKNLQKNNWVGNNNSNSQNLGLVKQMGQQQNNNDLYQNLNAKNVENDNKFLVVGDSQNIHIKEQQKLSSGKGQLYGQQKQDKQKEQKIKKFDLSIKM
ncbi:HAD-like domain [Pseudocohnilembus persalinus]|uniref:HAD-like domain n=1 Tax=Pseudocohnilembus persalinus TaxID=266149 RepID=A0A0V0QI58_PSEPJ|nr:HAD-like domain [Pseudocohnilembus persalinus]|eukprot:KRX01969.1 HAD-like domain [Pseudocohnilembus persalinus]